MLEVVFYALREKACIKLLEIYDNDCNIFRTKFGNHLKRLFFKLSLYSYLVYIISKLILVIRYLLHFNELGMMSFLVSFLNT